MEIHVNHRESPAEKDKNTRTLFPDCLFRLWNLRILLYTLVFLSTVIFLYREFVTEPLEMINNLNVSSNHFMWRTFNKGVGLLYMCYYLLLLILFVIEVTVCDFCSFYGVEDEEFIKISKIIRKGIIIVAILITCFIPFSLK